MTRLNYIVVWVGTFVILISFLLSIMLRRKNKKPDYMKNFFLYPLIGLLVSANTIFSRFLLIYSIKLNFLIQILLCLFDLIFWFLFFSNFFKTRKDITKIRLLFFFTIAIEIVLFQFSELNKSNLHTISIINICKTIFCIFFYYKLFKDVPTQNIKLEPSFWIITGLFFYSCLSIPLYALNEYVISKFSSIISSTILAISNIFVIIMHFFFIKAYLCTIRPHKVL